MVRTDLTKWRLHVHEGRQTWHYSESDQSEQSFIEKYWLGLLPESLPQDPPLAPQEAVSKGFSFFEQLLTEDGHWAGEYGGPLFLLAGLVIVYYATGIELEDAQRMEIVRYVKNTAQSKGGWGLHIEGEPIVLCSCLNYVVLRLLGVSPRDPVCVKAREFILENGSATAAPSWAKFWLAVLNVYDWQGVPPLLPELWLLPKWLPFHPSKLWCHARQIYLPMGYIYGLKYQCQEDELIRQLRAELYADFDNVDWSKAQSDVASVDCYAPHHPLLDVANYAQNWIEWMVPQSLRQSAMDEVLFQVRCDDANTDFISIGPISKMINMLVVYLVDGGDSNTFKAHVERCRDYLWIGPDGMRMQGTNGSQLWDTSFASMAMFESGLGHKHPEVVQRVLEYLDDCQLKENCQDYERCYRDRNKGAFPFSTRSCGWIVSDCAAEGLRAVLALQSLPKVPQLIDQTRIEDCVDVLLYMQNSDGGFASYEKRRGPFWLEKLNPSEVFGEIMVDYSYTECTSSVIQALYAASQKYPEYKSSQIAKCIDDGLQFIRDQQREDGSWFGSWGVCFTYGIWFAIEALCSCNGETYANSLEVRKACDFLISVQQQDGGFGESYKACTEKVYVQHEQSQVVNTSWALLSLLKAKYPHQEPLDRAARLLTSRQLRDGSWKQEGIEGVFNKTCMISYPNYKFIFPIWALGRYSASQTDHP